MDEQIPFPNLANFDALTKAYLDNQLQPVMQITPSQVVANMAVPDTGGIFDPINQYIVGQRVAKAEASQNAQKFASDVAALNKQNLREHLAIEKQAKIGSARRKLLNERKIPITDGIDDRTLGELDAATFSELIKKEKVGGFHAIRKGGRELITDDLGRTILEDASLQPTGSAKSNNPKTKRIGLASKEEIGAASAYINNHKDLFKDVVDFDAFFNKNKEESLRDAAIPLANDAVAVAERLANLNVAITLQQAMDIVLQNRADMKNSDNR